MKDNRLQNPGAAVAEAQNESAVKRIAKQALGLMKGNPIAVLLIIAAIIVGCVVDNFFSWANLANLLSNTAVRFLIALGVSGCLITKGTDLSAGRQVGLAACLSGILCQRADYTGRLWKSVPEMNIFLVLLIVIAIGFVVGSINGLIIAKLRVPPFIATLGTQTIIYGIALVLTDAQPIGGFQKIYTRLITGRIGNVRGFHIPYLAIVALVFGVLFWFIYFRPDRGPVHVVPVQQDPPRQVYVRHRRQRGGGGGLRREYHQDHHFHLHHRRRDVRHRRLSAGR